MIFNINEVLIQSLDCMNDVVTVGTKYLVCVTV